MDEPLDEAPEPATSEPPDEPPGVTRGEARAARATLRRGLGDVDGVQGIGIARADGGFCVVVNLRDGALKDHVPSVVAGAPVRVRVVGSVRTLRSFIRPGS